MKIFKHPLKITDAQLVRVPRLHKVLSVIEQNGKLVLYVIFNENDKQTVDIQVVIVGTGNPCFNGDVEDVEQVELMPTLRGIELPFYKFIGTVSMPPGVWHVFVKGE